MTSPNLAQVETVSDDSDAAMLATLYRCHARAVFAVCLANARNHHDAEDVMQAVFLKAVTKVSSLRDPERARGWLLQVARRECVDFHRRRKPMERLVTEPLAPPAENVAAGGVDRAIQQLPLHYRETIVLYYLDGRDCASVARTLGTTEQAVRQRLVRARAMLHDLLAGERI